MKSALVNLIIAIVCLVVVIVLAIISPDWLDLLFIPICGVCVFVARRGYLRSRGLL